MSNIPAEVLRCSRPRQWIKNGLLFAGFVFAGKFRQETDVLLGDLARVILAFAAFCLLSSAAYLVNDIADRESDRAHPDKCRRPIASGRLSPSAALVAVVVLYCAAFLLSVLVSLQSYTYEFLATAVTYALLTLAYSFCCKHWVLIDVLVLSAGFVLRVVAGCVALPVTISPWLIVCTLFLALFMVLCKRRHEFLLLGDENVVTRSVLPHYNTRLLDQMIAVAAGLTIMSYSLYTFSANHVPVLGRESAWVMLTIPFVVYGVFRYLYLVYRKDQGGSPEDVFSDVPMLVNLVAWGVVIVALSVLSLR